MVSAVEGIAVAVPKVGGDVVGISCAILAALFGLQFFGTKRVSYLFAPVIAIWLITIAISGIINITDKPGVFRGEWLSVKDVHGQDEVLMCSGYSLRPVPRRHALRQDWEF